jgi:hypothetical protein
MLSSTRLTFYDEVSVFWLRFLSQFWLILNSWILIRITNADLDPDAGSQSNADPDPKHW